jgi:hypothetical protein
MPRHVRITLRDALILTRGSKRLVEECPMRATDLKHRSALRSQENGGSKPRRDFSAKSDRQSRPAPCPAPVVSC